jgi:ATP-dependent DNA helicase RecQ
MFTEFVPVNEEQLSSKSGLSRDTVYNYLVKLSGQNIIRYIPGKRSQLVILTEERLGRKDLYISPENHLHARERYEERIGKMIEYATLSAKCRSVFLLGYFGEEADRCGICDICRNRNELDLSKYEFDTILSYLKALIIEKQPTEDELMKQTDHQPEKIIRVLRYLIDHNKIVVAGGNRLLWRQ